jgi:hypothetical protein
MFPPFKPLTWNFKTVFSIKQMHFKPETLQLFLSAQQLPPADPLQPLFSIQWFSN